MYVVLTMFAYFVLENNSTDQENDFLALQYCLVLLQLY